MQIRQKSCYGCAVVIPQALQLSFSCCDRFRELMKHEDAEITQVQAGNFTNALTLVPLEHMVFRYGTRTTPWIAHATAARGHVSLLMDLNYQNRPVVNGLQQEQGPLLQLYGSGAEHCSAALQPGEYAMLPIPGKLLEDTLSGLGIKALPVTEGRLTAMHTEPGTLRLLDDVFQSLRTSATRSPELFISKEVRQTAEREILTRLALAIGRAEPCQEIHHGRDRMKVFRKAREFMLESAHHSIYLADLCTATGVSERTLRDTFQTVLGISPLKYLQLRRMRQVRNALLHADKQSHSVKALALASGFWELGRFAVEYKRLFGESPSETLGQRA